MCVSGGIRIIWVSLRSDGRFTCKTGRVEAASKPSFDKSWASPRAPSENPEFFMKERRFKSE